MNPTFPNFPEYSTFWLIILSKVLLTQLRSNGQNLTLSSNLCINLRFLKLHTPLNEHSVIELPTLTVNDLSRVSISVHVQNCEMSVNHK